MGVGDHQLHTTQAPPGQLAQEGRPDRFGFGGTHLHAQIGPYGQPHSCAPTIKIRYRSSPGLRTHGIEKHEVDQR